MHTLHFRFSTETCEVYQGTQKLAVIVRPFECDEIAFRIFCRTLALTAHAQFSHEPN